ncbi:TetR/AcrR family transcriptional regulator [Microseira wollei]|uniref:Transcriptional regulator n=1 Tax=Microseira wollei NIES-4236 TaxID=2530354 RepID=A0AAV3XFM3_9CYAN|nr:TetR/AcrR family transcriptional regulator [Microseira wollei]GET38920.1 transcriptional regulator [Microseira wollei NIES-4236]
MSKASDTRAYIIMKAAELFNQKGFAGSSMADVMKATGLQKGGIYNHFQSKEELAIASFDYAVDLLHQRYRQVLRSSPNSISRLLAFIDAFCEIYDDPPLKGGCPIMNAAIEQDSHQAALHERAIAAMNQWRDFLCKIVARGIDRGEISPRVHPDEIATLTIGTLEGGLMLSQLYGDRIYLQRSAEHLRQYFQQLSN